MNIAPLMFIDNVYVQVSDNKLRYIDKDRNILKEFDVERFYRKGNQNCFENESFKSGSLKRTAQHNPQKMVLLS